jgi:integrase
MNTMPDTKEPPVIRPRVRIGITLAQHQKILAHADAMALKWPWWGYACRLGWETGLRISDVSTLKWECVNLEDGLITLVPHKLRRLNRRVTIPLHEEMRDYMKKLRENPPRPWYRNNEFVEPLMSGYYNSEERTCLHKQFQTICVRAGMDYGISFGWYRNAFFKRLVDANATLPVIASMTGASLATILSYARITIGTKCATLEEMRALLEQVRPKFVPTPPPVA